MHEFAAKYRFIYLHFWPMNAEQENSNKLKYFFFLQYLQPYQIVWAGKYVGCG